MASKFIVGTNKHADLLEGYITGRFPKIDIEFSRGETPNNAVTTAYCLDHADSRMGTIVLFCDLIPLSNISLRGDTVLTAKVGVTKGNIGSFRHSQSNGVILEWDTPVKFEDLGRCEGILGNFVLSDTIVLKSIAYSGFSSLVDLTSSIIVPYSAVKSLHFDVCNKVFEFGDSNDLRKVREMWEC